MTEINEGELWPTGAMVMVMVRGVYSTSVAVISLAGIPCILHGAMAQSFRKTWQLVLGGILRLAVGFATVPCGWWSFFNQRHKERARRFSPNATHSRRLCPFPMRFQFPYSRNFGDSKNLVVLLPVGPFLSWPLPPLSTKKGSH